MTTTEEAPTMTDHARKLRDDLEQTVDRICRLRSLDDRGESAAEELDDELSGRVLSADVKVAIDVTLYTGGPAGGVLFECEMGDHGELEWLSARAWHQDWYQAKGWWPLDDNTAEFLWFHWGLEGIGVR